MRYLLGVLSLVLVAMPLGAGEKANVLSPKEIAEGWLLLFDGETTFGWKTEGKAAVRDGAWTLGGDQRTEVEATAAFGDFELQFEYRQEGEKKASIHLRDSAVPGPGLGFFQTTEQGWYRCTVAAGRNPKTGVQRIIYRHTAPSGKGLHESSTEGGGARPSHIVLRVDAGGQLSVRNVKLKPLSLQPLFNGKDLSAWKVFPGAKYQSKFTVDQGVLTMKSGPGDLQTEGQWADFLLQLECRVNGAHLNSGVFFRCIPDQYQQGYEAQIHNRFTADPPREYDVPDYDPKTNQQTGTRKVKSAAVDYGTGAIYRRIPARRGVAKDNEWFTMTVLARGRHIAVWVNGVAVTDWTDNRLPNDNGRNGYRAAKGPISLQGHDPTTDLSFRNIRIAELPEGGKK